MKFGNFPLHMLQGAMLAHAIRLPSGLLKKGHIISGADIKALAEEDITHAMAAIPEAGDMAEDEAARKIANHIAGDHIRCAGAFTGRVNLYAAGDGLVILNEAAVNRLNRRDEAITLATVRQNAIARKGQMVATVKIIPLAVRAEDIINLIADMEGRLITLHPFRPQKAVMIHTMLSGSTEKLFEKARKVMTHRLAGFATCLVEDVRCNHEEQALADILQDRSRTDHDMMLIMGASAITDRRDVIPAAILRAGGEIIHYGMPVDPGNLMLLAKLRGKWVLGLPGCARSPKLNGIDLILSRIAAGFEVTQDDVTAMGVGGLLSEYPGRPEPRERKRRKSPGQKVAALVLAAGQSRRMRKNNKLLLPYKGKTVISHVLDQVKNAGVSDILVVTGHQRDEVEQAVSSHNVTFVHNDLYAEGMSGSVKLGIASLAEDCDAVIIILGDMPAVSADIIRTIIAAYNPPEGHLIVIPTHNGKRGNPILWDREFFADFDRLDGDMGAKILLNDYPEYIREIEINSEAVFLDIDTVTAYEKLK